MRKEIKGKSDESVQIWYHIVINNRRQLPASCCRHYNVYAPCQLEWAPAIELRTSNNDEQFAALELRLVAPNGVYSGECSSTFRSYVFWRVYVPLCVPMIVAGRFYDSLLNVQSPQSLQAFFTSSRSASVASQ